MRFQASFDKTTRILTIIILFILVVIFGLMLKNLETVGSIVFSMIIFVFLASFVLPYWFSINYYELTNEILIIQRPFSKIKYPLHQIASVERIEPKLLRWSWRVFGSGGLFGYYGTFINKNFGTMKWYLTRRDQIIFIKTTKNKKLIISPDEPVVFLKELQRLKGFSR